MNEVFLLGIDPDKLLVRQHNAPHDRLVPEALTESVQRTVQGLLPQPLPLAEQIDLQRLAVQTELPDTDPQRAQRQPVQEIPLQHSAGRRTDICGDIRRRRKHALVSGTRQFRGPGRQADTLTAHPGFAEPRPDALRQQVAHAARVLPRRLGA